MNTYNISLLCGFIVPYLIWFIRYIRIFGLLERKNFIMFVYTSLLSIFLSLNQFLVNFFNLDIWVFLLFQILLLPFLKYYDKDIRKVYKNKQINK